MIIAIETVLECEGVHDLELFPHDDPGCANLTRLDPK